jgi:predicted glycoside hydrolase/deacetylase ChbG (UPF0249 family)/predicted neuraminidase
MKKIWLPILISLLGLSLFAQTGKSSKTVVSEEFIFPFQNEHVHGSSIVILPGGDLLACWFQGHGERSADDVRIMGARKKSGSGKWSEPFLMADTKGIPDCNPVLFVNGKGKLFLFWIAVMANKWENSVIRFKTTSDFSGDGAPNWQWQDNILLKPSDDFASEVEKKFAEMPGNEAGWAAYAPKYDDMIIAASRDLTKRSFGWMTRIHPLTLKSGRILLPLYSDGFNFSIAAISDDDGLTWRPGLPIVGRGPIQPALAEKKDGTVVAYMRDSGDSPTRVHVAVSSDRGESWSYSRKCSIPNEASVELCTLKDGKWAYFGNDIDDGRYQLSLYLSDDEGFTWKWKQHIEYDSTRKGSYSYPCLIQSDDGLIHITYSWSRGEGKKTIKHVVVDPAGICANVAPEKITWAEKLGWPAGKKVILLHMDDAGMCPEANSAVENYISSSKIMSTAVMMPCPEADKFVEWARQHPEGDIGVHLTLTSEWQHYRWGPLTAKGKVPGLIDPEGKLWHEVPDVAMHAKPQEVETEIRTQIDRMISLGQKPSHIDTHMGTMYATPDYLKAFLKVAEEYRIPANIIEFSDPGVADVFRKQGYPVDQLKIKELDQYSQPRLDNFSSVPEGKTYEEKMNNFFALVKSLQPGLTEIIFHPSVESDNLKSITGSWQQRVWEGKMFSDPKVQNFLKEEGIIITTWKEIMERYSKRPVTIF